MKKPMLPAKPPRNCCTVGCEARADMHSRYCNGCRRANGLIRPDRRVAYQKSAQPLGRLRALPVHQA